MSLVSFIFLGLLNGLLIGCTAGLLAHAISDGASAMRFRDAASLGMLGSFAGSIVASALDSDAGYVGAPSSLFFHLAGAVFAIACANLLRRRSVRQLSRS